MLAVILPVQDPSPLKCALARQERATSGQVFTVVTSSRTSSALYCVQHDMRPRNEFNVTGASALHHGIEPSKVLRCLFDVHPVPLLEAVLIAISRVKVKCGSSRPAE